MGYAAHPPATPRGRSRLRLAEFLPVRFPVSYPRISGGSEKAYLFSGSKNGHLLCLAAIDPGS